MKIAITGGNGHVGTAVCRALIEEGHQLNVLIRQNGQGFEGLPVLQIAGSTSDPAALDRLMAGCEAVVHLAALISIGMESEADLYRVNVEGTRNVLDAAIRAGLRRMIHFSSVHAYETPPHQVVFDETAPLAIDGAFGYTRTKAAAQMMVMACRDMETIVMNPTSVLGPWDFKPSLQGQMLVDMAAGKLPVMPPGGFDWVDNRDIASAVVAALQQGTPGQAYLLSGTYLSVQDMASSVARLAGRTTRTVEAPIWLLKGFLPFIQLWSRWMGEPPLYTQESLHHLQDGHPKISSEKAKQELGYKVRSVEQTIEDSLNWLRTYSKSEK